MSRAGELAGHTCLVGVYLLLNTGLNMTNRYVLGIYGFSFPMLLTMSHLCFSFIALSGPVLLKWTSSSVQRTSWRKQWRGLALVGTFMAMNIGLNNVSLVRLPLSLNQVLRASLPVVTAVVAVFVESKRPTKNETWALLLLTVGVCLTVFEGNVPGNAAGLSLAVAGVLCAAAMMCTAGKMLQEKLDVFQLTFYTAPVSIAVLFPFFIARELDRFKLYMAEHGPAVLVIVLASSAVALAYNLVHYYLLQKTSSITVTVLGEVKIVGLLVLSAIFLPGETSQLSLRMLLGMVTAMLGFCLYSNVRLWQPRLAAGKDPVKDEEAAQLLSEGEAEVVQGQSRSERQRHRSMCMHAPSSSFVAILQQISFNSKGPAAASPRPRPRSADWESAALGPSSVGLGQHTTSQPSLATLVVPGQVKSPLERASSADVGSLLPLSSLDGPDTPPRSPPATGSLLRSKSLGGSSGSGEGSPEGASTPPAGAGPDREPLLPSLVLPAAGPAWACQRGVSPRKASAPSQIVSW